MDFKKRAEIALKNAQYKDVAKKKQGAKPKKLPTPKAPTSLPPMRSWETPLKPNQAGGPVSVRPPVVSPAKPWEKPLSPIPVDAGPKTRLEHAANAAAEGMLEGFSGLIGTAADAATRFVDSFRTSKYSGAERDAQRFETALRTGRTADGKPINAAQRKTLEAALAKSRRVMAESKPTGTMESRNPGLASAREAFYDLSDDLAQRQAKSQQSAKQGLGKAGQFGVDLGIAGAQMVGDAVLGGLPVMFARSAGSAANEARREGADFMNQLSYGLGSGAISVATEKISNVAAPFKAAFGPGFADAAINKMVGRLGGSKIGKLALSAISEGGEEFIEDVFQPILQRATWDPNARFNLDEALYDAAIGAALGGFGSVGEIAATPRAQKAVQEATREAQSTLEQPTKPNYTPDVESVPAASEGFDEAPTVQAETAKPVKMTPIPNKPDPVSQILSSGKRVNQSQLTTEQFNIMADRGDVAMDAAFNVYKVNPEQHIDRRSKEHIANRRVNSFQFDHPELHDYYAPAAKELFVELENYQPGGQIQTATGEYGQTYSWRTKRNASPRIASMLDAGMGKDRIAKALDAIIKDHGADNYSDAKRVEMVLDDMLSNGYNDGAKFVPANDQYIADKSNIDGNRAAEYGHGLDDLDAENGLGAADRYSLNTDFDELQAQKSQFHPEGANAARPVDVPTTGFDGRKISKSASTVLGAKAIPDVMVPEIDQFIADGLASYTTLSDRKSLDRAESVIRSKGFDGAMESFRRDVQSGKGGKDIVVLGQRLMANAASAQDGNALAELFHLYSSLSVDQARGLQAMSLFRKLSPESQLYAVQKAVDSINDTIMRPKKKKGHPDSIPVDQWMQKTGERLANRLETATTAKPETVQSVTQSILSDITKYAEKGVQKAERKGVRPRSEADRLYDLFNNYEQYTEAWEAAKEKIREKFGNDPEAMQAFNEWLEQDAASAFFSDVVGDTIEVDAGLMSKFLAQKDQQGRDAVMEEIIDDLATKVPVTALDKWNAIRFTNMLGNFKTMGRNVIGNVGMKGMASVNNAIAASLQKLIRGAEQTRSVTVDKSLMNAAKEYFETVKEVAMGQNKYSDTGMSRNKLMQEIKSRQELFKFKPMEYYRKGTDWLMNNQFFGDEAFSRASFSRYLAGYLKAKGITAEQFSSPDWRKSNAELVENATDFAIKQAQENTFRDSNALSEWVSQIGRRPGTPWFVRVLSEGLSPFRKTPANVAVRMEQYSPLGVINTVANVVRMKQGNATLNDVVESMAKTMTGTGLFAMGMILRNAGWLRGGGDSDDDQDKFEELQGHQPYSLELPNGMSVTLDWLAPPAMPLFMGVQLFDEIQENGFQIKDFEKSLTSIADPMIEMSMMQGINDTLSVMRGKDANFGQVASKVALSYLTQGLTNSLVGQLSRSTKDVGMMTYVDKESAMPDWLQREVGKASRRMPGKGFQQIPYIDAWGRTESTGGVGKRLFDNMVNPAFTSKIEETDVERELQKIKDATGSASVFPERADKSFTVDGEEKNLSADEYVKYAKKKGETSRSGIESLISQQAFKSLSWEDKAKAVQQVYEYANAIAKASVSDYKPSGFAAGAMKSPLPIGKYVLYRIKADKDGNKDISTVEAAEALNSLSGVSKKDKGKQFELTVSKDFNPEKNPFTGRLSAYGLPPETVIEVQRRYTEVNKMSGKEKKYAAKSFYAYLNTLPITPAQKAQARHLYTIFGFHPIK